ncbi:MAG TPA: V-type ATPase 116kDa subunit family protein [Candidatus Peribacteraceae bacterium]|nr:V-type ATPase 116kDa subunit family protein [Candidatus Peribacteraceae bacterium]
MAVVHMQKVAVLARRSLKEELLETLQEAGVMEVSEATQPVQTDETEMNFRIAELDAAIATLTAVAPKDVQTAMRRQATPEDVLKAARHTDVRGIVDELHALETMDTEHIRRAHELSARIEELTPWRHMPFRLDASAETQTAIRILGRLPDTNIDALRDALQRRVPRSELSVYDAVNGSASVSAIVWKEDQRTFEEAATALGWTTVQLPALAGTARTIGEEAAVELRKIEKQTEENRTKRTQLAHDLPNLIKMRTFMHWLRDKQGVRDAVNETFATVMLLGWVPRKKLDALEKRLQQLSPDTAVLKVKPDEHEEAPVLIQNAAFFTPFESVTTLYGLPRPSEFDPTVALSPFFIVYFALCLTDGGYGITIAIGAGLMLLFTRQSPRQNPLVWLLLFSGILSFLVGIPFGGWWGLSPDKVPSVFTTHWADGSLHYKGQVWDLNAQSGISFLQNLALFLGLTHLFFGMFLAGIHKWIHGQRAAAFWQDFTSHLLLGGVLFYFFAPANLHQVALYTMIATIVLAVWGKGYGNKWYLRPVMGLLGIVNLGIGLLSNGLSYLRILALGLVTGAMAMAVDQVASAMSALFPVWWLAIPVLILIFLIGQTVSIALNTLGSFIHSSRLQFIEFFGQFFEGGGRPFMPFERSAQPSD